MAAQPSIDHEPGADAERRPDPAVQKGPLRRSFDMGPPARAGLAALGVVLLLFILWYVAQVLLLLFAGILLAILLHAVSEGICRLLVRVPFAFCLTTTALALVALVAIGGWRMTPIVIEQGSELIDGLADAVDAVEDRLRRADWSDELAGRLDIGRMLPDPGSLMGQATGLLTAGFGAVATVAIVMFFGIYLAASPATYIEGFVHLLPPARRVRARYVLAQIGHTLRWWLIGQAVSMTVVGVASYIGLRLLGVPFAATLAILAGLMTFIPYMGPILSSIPITLVALTVSGTLALYTLAFYTALQMFEGYVLTPLVQRRAVRLPPALNIFSQVLLSVLFGAAGLVLAAPLAAVALITVKLVYVEGVLGEEVEED